MRYQDLFEAKNDNDDKSVLLNASFRFAYKRVLDALMNLTAAKVPQITWEGNRLPDSGVQNPTFSLRMQCTREPGHEWPMIVTDEELMATAFTATVRRTLAELGLKLVKLACPAIDPDAPQAPDWWFLGITYDGYAESPQVRDLMFKSYVGDKTSFDTEVDVKQQQFFHDDEKLRIELYWDVHYSMFSHYHLFTPEDQAKIDAMAFPALKKMNAQFAVKTKGHDLVMSDVDLNTSPSLSAAAKIPKYEAKMPFMKTLKQAFAARYHHFNSYEHTKSINAIKDHNAQRQAMNDVGEKMKQIFQNLGKVS